MLMHNSDWPKRSLETSIYFDVVVLEHILECVFRLLLCENLCPQTSQAYGFTPVWMRTCSVKLPFVLKDFPQTTHLWVFSPVWVSLCCFNWLLWAKDLPHTSQEKGFSPVCVRTCRSILHLAANCFPHWEHAWGFSPLWTLIWRRRRYGYVNSLTHTGHRCFFCLDEEGRLSSPTVEFWSVTTS